MVAEGWINLDGTEFTLVLPDNPDHLFLTTDVEGQRMIKVAMIYASDWESASEMWKHLLDNPDLLTYLADGISRGRNQILTIGLPPG